MSGSRGALLAAAALLVPILLAATPVQAAVPQWWGPTAPDDGHHLRLGAVVAGGPSGLPANAVVAFEADLGKALAAAGWPHTDVGGSPILQGFRLDEASVRVVAMMDLEPLAPGTSHGQMRAVDASRPPSDPLRYELPSQTYLGSLKSKVSYHPASNPVITVLWRIPEAVPAGTERSFFVYFDSLTSADPKEPAAPAETLLGGDVLGLFWSGWGLRAYGYSKPIDGRANALTVVAQRAGTDVEVFTAVPGRPFQLVDSFRIDAALGFRQVAVPGTSALVLKVQASAPIFAQSTSSGFVPSLDAGMAGREFVFAMSHAASWEQDTVYFAATDPADTDGRLDPTTIEVTRLDASMPPVQFALGGSASPRDYSVGARAAIERGACSRPIPGAMSPTLPFGPGLYRARVIPGGERVLLQYQAVDGLSQAPTATGAPAGEEFFAAFGWSDETGSGFACSLETRPGTMYAANLGTTSVFNVTSDDLVFQAYPRGAPNPVAARFPPGRAVAGDRTLQGPFDITNRDSADRMLRIAATEPMQVLVGQGRQQTDTVGGGPPFAGAVYGVSNVPVVNGPLGGMDGGRVFAGMGPAVLVSPFDGNSVQVELRYSGGWQTKTVTLSRDAMYELKDASPSNPLLDYRVKARFPLVVNPALASSGVLASVPALVGATVADASFRGFLLDLSSPDGDPATRSTTPGLPAKYPVVLKNLARQADGSLLDDQAFLTADAPDGWTVALDGAPLGAGKSISLSPGQALSGVVTVTPPADVAIDTTQPITLRATSAGNDRVSDTLQLVTFVKTVYQIGIWFDEVDGGKDQEIQLVPGESGTTFHLVVQNAGSKTERVEVSVALRGGASGWQAGLGDDALGKLEFDLPPAPEPDEGTELELRMVAPAGVPDAEATAVVTARIVGVQNAKDAVQATAKRSAPADVQLRGDRLTAFTLPGQPAVFPLVVTSEGGGIIRFEVQSGNLKGWQPPRLVGGNSPDGVTNLTLTRGQQASLSLLVEPDPNAYAGNTTTVRVAAIDRDGHASERVVFVKVLPRHALSAATPASAIGVDGPGADTTFTVRWTNAGNLAERLRLAPARLPPGWSLNVTPELLVPRGASQDVKATVTAAPDAEPGVHEVWLSATSADGNRTLAKVLVLVDDRSAASAARAPAAVRSQPGSLAPVRFNATNNGTLPVRLTVAPAEGEDWTFQELPNLLLQPNQTAQLTLRWNVPADAPDGLSVHRALVRFEGRDGPLPPTVVEGRIDVGRAALGVQEVVAAAGPAGGLVRATIANTGDRPALAFDVQLLDDAGEAVDTVRVARLEAGANLTLSLAMPKAAGTLRVDAGDAVPELDESDNQAPVEWTLPKDAPSPVFAWAFLLLAVLAHARRRRR